MRLLIFNRTPFDAPQAVAAQAVSAHPPQPAALLHGDKAALHARAHWWPARLDVSAQGLAIGALAGIDRRHELIMCLGDLTGIRPCATQSAQSGDSMLPSFAS